MTAIGPCSWLSAAALRPYPQWAQLERPIPRHFCSGTQAFVPVGNPRWRGHCAGRTRCVFEALQVALRSRPSRLIFYAFDLLHLDGKDLFDRPWSNAGRNSWNWSGTTRKVQFSSAKSSLAMLPHSFAPVPHMSLRGEAREDFEARLGKLRQVSFGWRVLCTAKTLGFHFCRSELTRFAFSRLPSAYSINSWLT